MFDYEDFAKQLQEECRQVIPSDFSKEDCSYICKINDKYTKLCGAALKADYEEDFNDNQKIFIIQAAAEWIYHISVDLIMGKIPEEYRDDILKQIAYAVFKTSTQEIKEDTPNTTILGIIEPKVRKIYRKNIENLYNKQLISYKTYKTAIIQSNIDKISEKENDKDNQTKEVVPKDYELDDIRDKIANIFTDASAFILSVLILFFLFNSVKYIRLYHIFTDSTVNEIISLASIQNTEFILFFSIILLAYIRHIAAQNNIKKNLNKLDDTRHQMQDLVNPNKMYERLRVDIIQINIGQGLICIADPEQNGQLLAKLAALRQRLTDELGFIIPNVRVMDSQLLKDNEYAILTRNNVIYNGFVSPERSDATDIIINNIKEALIKNADTVITEQDIVKYIELAKSDGFASSKHLLKNLDYCDIKEVFANLIKEKVSIKDILFILSKLSDYSRYYKEPDILSERIRKDLSKQISVNNYSENKKIYAITLSKELSNHLLEKIKIQKGFSRTELILDKNEELELKEKIINEINQIKENLSQKPVVICDEKLRLGLFRMLSYCIDDVVVLAKCEIEKDIKVEITKSI